MLPLAMAMAMAANIRLVPSGWPANRPHNLAVYALD
jgi:hypothetical protein